MEIYNTYGALIATIIALAFLIISKLVLVTPKNRKLPPGPKPWPIIGNLNLVGPNKHLSLHLLSQKYGGIMLLKFFTSRVVVVSSPEMAKQFLQNHDKVFASRPLLAAGKYTNYDCSNLLWAPLGPSLRQRRKIMTSEMLTPSKLAFYEHIRIEETRNFLSSLQALSGKPVIIRDHIARLPLSIMARTVYGDRHFSRSKNEKAVQNLDKLQGLIQEWFIHNGVFCIGDWLRCLRFLDLQGCIKKMKAYQKKFDKFVDRLIDDHLADRAATSDFMPQDVLDCVLQLAADDPSLRVKAIIQDILTGGTESSANVVEWAIQELCKQPVIIEKAKEELDRVIGRNRWVTENDLTHLPYIDAIIIEALRLHPPATILPPHYTTEDCNVEGYDIPKGTVIMINAWSIGRDSDTWDDAPEKFLPERFFGKQIDLANNFTLLPFGSGRRMCPAYKSALNSVRLVLANLVHGFHWKLTDGMQPEDISMEELCQLTTVPKRPLSMIFEPTLLMDYY